MVTLSTSSEQSKELEIFGMGKQCNGIFGGCYDPIEVMCDTVEAKDEEDNLENDIVERDNTSVHSEDPFIHNLSKAGSKMRDMSATIRNLRKEIEDLNEDHEDEIAQKQYEHDESMSSMKRKYKSIMADMLTQLKKSNQEEKASFDKELKSVKNERDAIKEKLEIEVGRSTKLEETVAEFQALKDEDQNKLDSTLKSITEERDSLKKDLNLQMKKTETLKERIAQNESTLKTITDENDALKQVIKVNENKTKQLEEKIAQLEISKQKDKAVHENIMNRFEEKAKQFDTSSREKTLESSMIERTLKKALDIQIEKAKQVEADHKMALRELKKQLISLKNSEQSLNNDKKKLQEKVSLQANNLEAANKSKKSMQQSLSLSDTRVEELNKQLEKARESNKTLLRHNEKITELMTSLEDTSNQDKSTVSKYIHESVNKQAVNDELQDQVEALTQEIEEMRKKYSDVKAKNKSLAKKHAKAMKMLMNPGSRKDDATTTEMSM